MFRTIAVALLIFVSAWSQPSHAQVPIGTCVIPSANLSYTIIDNLLVVQNGNPANAGFGARDPSGMTFMRLPSTTPTLNAYFVAWNGNLVQVWSGGWNVMGTCAITLPPPVPTFFPGAQPHYGVPVLQNPNSSYELAAIPAPIVTSQSPYGLPLIASSQDAQQCAVQHSSGTSPAFRDCMVHAMVGNREGKVYDCAKTYHNSPPELSACVIASLGGANEQKYAQQFISCYQDSNANGDYQSMSLCMAGQNMSNDMARLVQCVSKQGSSGNVSVLSAAVCYGSDKLNLNTESQIVVQCAVATGGEPQAFAACAGGKLTAMELAKCSTGGIGQPGGCFGPNNDIVKYLKNYGVQLAAIFGPASLIVKDWEAAVDKIASGAVKAGATALRNVANETAKGASATIKAVGSAAQEVMPRITIGKPKGKIFGKRFSL